jgi:diguanylate cyclase
VLGALEHAGVDPARLIVEITETADMDDARRTGHHLVALADAGVRIAIDDFGTGYTSLDHVQHLPIEILKIDRSFTSRLGTPAGDDLMAALHQLASALGVLTIAEGVETAEQLARVREIGFSAVQGFYVARPAPAHALRHIVGARAVGHTATDAGEAVS